tara:strand:+ start:83 stop:502 length:420 start_codon:yes stop_codon:yes gene_type:complete
MEKCLISKDEIEHKITLPCNHSFDYIYLYYEIIEQNKNKRLNTPGFNCPYCRQKYNKNIPYYEIENVSKIKHINYKQSITLPILLCSKCDNIGHSFNHGIFCIKHSVFKERCNCICKNGKKCNNYAVIKDKCKKHSIKI